MASDVPTAAWHPALMPNSSAHTTVVPNTHALDSHPDPAHTSSLDATPAANPQSGAISPPLQRNIAHESSDADHWFPDYDAGSLWNSKAESQAQALQVQALHDVANQQPDDASFNAVESTSRSTRHVSNDSFARTVSHQPIFSDDGEPDWTLPAAETDVYNKYLPPAQSTTPFPAVPQSKHRDGERKPQLLPPNQALDVVSGIERQSESLQMGENGTSDAPGELQQDDFWGNNNNGAFTFHGCEALGPDEQNTDARYEEGLPLINYQDPEEALVDRHAQSDDLFPPDTAGKDDFFQQIRSGVNGVDHQNLLPGQLERKSTMQVLAGLCAADSRAPGLASDAAAQDTDEDQPGHLADTEDKSAVVAPLTNENTPAAGIAGQDTGESQGEEDLAARWSEAFGGDDDDDFLQEDEPAVGHSAQNAIDPSAFFIDDDDEGFLDDTEDMPSSQSSHPSLLPSSQTQTVPTPSSTAANKYLPTGASRPGIVQSPASYFPNVSPSSCHPQAPDPIRLAPSVPANPYAIQPPPSQTSVSAPYSASAPRSTITKAQSFADKSKGGYHSPYDLPMEVVKPRRRAGLQQSPRGSPGSASAPPPPPSRSGSMHNQRLTVAPGPPLQHPLSKCPPQLQTSAPGISPPTSNDSGQSPASSTKPPQQLKSRDNFFESLPISNKVRPASRTTSQGQTLPSQAAFDGPSPGCRPSPPSMLTPPHEPSSMFGHPTTSDIPNLIPPVPSNPYASLPKNINPAASLPPAAAARYSPAPPPASMANGSMPHPVSRYSPAQRTSATPPTALTHLPRTSSPLAHFEVTPDRTIRPGTGETGLHSTRSSSLSYEPRLNRMSSLPPTREVEEEDSTIQPLARPQPLMTAVHNPSVRENQPGRASSIGNLENTATALPASYTSTPMSPPKRRTSCGPAPSSSEILPPPRPQVGSPGAMRGLESPTEPAQMAPCPSSAHGPSSTSRGGVSPPLSRAAAPASTMLSRAREMSQKLNVISPTDGREHDPLERWKGCPLISWGSSGAVVTTFPVDVPKYGVNQPVPMIVRSPGVVRVTSVKNIQPLEELLASFPGPLRGKSKKKETVVWLGAGIQELEKRFPDLAFQPQLSHGDKRAVERILLWKILRTLVENDGVLEGNATVDKSVRDVLSLAATGQDENISAVHSPGNGLGGFVGASSATQMQSDSVDSGTIEKLKHSLLVGDREKAVWNAADKRLWGHALLIANTVSPDLYHKVSQEFIKKEVNFPGHNNESLAAFYAVLSGNHAESVDELVPTHARAGVQLIASSSGSAAGGLEGLDKWRETLTLVLGNRSPGDVQALNSLGNLLSEYGRAEAAHICFLFARSVSVFGGLDDYQAQFVLVGADHRKQPEQFFKETEALLLSEVYEYGLSLAGTPQLAGGVPHLAAYKLQHAMTLAEHGLSDKALQYCDITLRDMGAQTRRSPYHHAQLEAAFEDLRQRIIQGPSKEASSSWISKPNMNKVSDSMWNRFNKFVAGDEREAPAQGNSPQFAEEPSGPFARLAGGTPTISRPASVSNATGMEMFGTLNTFAGGAPPLVSTTAAPQVTRASSRYAPTTTQPTTMLNPYEPNSTYTPVERFVTERTSGEYSHGSYESRQSLPDVQAAPTSDYASNSAPAPTHNYPDSNPGMSSQPAYQPTTAQITDLMTPGVSPCTPFSHSSFPHALVAPAATNSSPYVPVTVTPGSDDRPVPQNGQPEPNIGYQPSSYSHEPATAEAVQGNPPHIVEEPGSSGVYEPASYQPYGYEPPSYEVDAEAKANDAANDESSKPKKKSFMGEDDDDNFPSMTSMKARQMTKERDKENEEMFRKVVEEEAKRAEAEKAAKAKKGWGFGGWFGGGPSKDSLESSANKPIRAKLGEKSSFVYDPEQKRWINKAAGAEDEAPKAATLAPPRSTAKPAGLGAPPPPGLSSSAPPPRTSSTPGPLESGRSSPSLSTGPRSSAPPPMLRTASSSGSMAGPPTAPPSRPATSMSHASSIDDLLGAAVPRKGAGARGKKKGGRYVDVMAK